MKSSSDKNDSRVTNLVNDLSPEINRRIELVMSAFLQDLFLRASNVNLHPLELLNKIMILIQYPIAFAITQKTINSDNTESIKVRTFIEDDIYGVEFKNALAGARSAKKYSPFKIFPDGNEHTKYYLYVFAIKKQKNKKVRFRPISRTSGYHSHSEPLELQISLTLNVFFKYFESSQHELLGIKPTFNTKTFKGLQSFFKSNPSAIINEKEQVDIADYIPNIDEFYERLEGAVLEKVYSKKVENFSVSIKELTQRNHSHSYLPNIILFSKTMKLPLESPRAKSVVTDAEGNTNFDGYKFNTKLIGSKSQRKDIKKFLSRLKEGYLNEGGDVFLRSVDIRPYSELGDNNISVNDEKVMASYDALFKLILTEEVVVDLATGKIDQNLDDYSEEKGVDCILDIYFKHTANSVRGLTDSVMYSGLTMIRFPFDQAGGLGLVEGTPHPIDNNATLCDINILSLVVTHYCFEGLSPLSKDRDTSSLALITFPIYVSGRVPVTCSHLLHVERNALNDAMEDETILKEQSGTWDQVFYLSEYLAKEIKSNFRRGYWKHYIHEMELIIKDEIYAALQQSTDKSLANTFKYIDKRFEALTYFYPFMRVQFIGEINPKTVSEKAITFAGIKFVIRAQNNDNFTFSTAGDPFQVNRITTLDVLSEAFRSLCHKFELEIVSQFIFSKNDSDIIINPHSALTTRLIENQGIENKYILELKKVEWAKAHNEKYVPNIDEATKDIAMTILNNRRIKFLQILQKAKDGDKVFTRYTRSKHETPLNYLKLFFGEFLKVFNDTENFMTYSELGIIDFQFRDTLKKYLEREVVKETGLLDLKTYVPDSLT